MLTFLLWNINRTQPAVQLQRLVERHNVDVLILLESGFRSPGDVIDLLNTTAHPLFLLPTSKVKPILILTRFSRRFTTPLYEKNRLTIRRIALPGREEFLLAAVHFVSKLWMKDPSQDLECSRLSRYIIDAENIAGHARTLLVGDMNMNPFQNGMIATGSLNAVMTRQVAERGKRRVQGNDHPFFYNPMWGLLGDATAGPPGTYYRDGGDHHDYFWNMFDQVLVRPPLLPRFRNQEVQILSDDGIDSLLDANGKPDANFSDHLPLLFKLNI